MPMLNAADLRKGNLLEQVHPNTSLPGVMVEVLAAGKESITFMYPNLEHRVEPFEDDLAEIGEGTIPYHELEPVALTEDWLKKAGFECNGNLAQLKANKDLAFTWDGSRLVATGQRANHKPLFYLHELQNSFEDETGSKLDINLHD